jgi:hypothetical protein
MSKFELKEGQGSLFKNRKKEKETYPDWTGEIKINGQVYWLSAWDKHSDKAGQWFSIGTKKKDFSEAKKAVSNNTSNDSDEIPF